jgi:hypothetical protein
LRLLRFFAARKTRVYLGMIYPVLLLIFMMRPAVVAAFQPPAPPQM